MNNKKCASLFLITVSVLLLNPAIAQTIKQAESSESGISQGGSTSEQTTPAQVTDPSAPAMEQSAPQESPASGQPVQEVNPSATLKGNYEKLGASLQRRDWQNADSETYRVMLEVAGDKSKQEGRLADGEWQNFSCPDLGEIDRLWSEVSDNKLGFSAQKRIFEVSYNAKVFYSRIRWLSLSNAVTWLVAWEYKPGSDPALQYRPGREPNFTNPPEGHLPAKLAWEPMGEEDPNLDHRFEMMRTCGM